MSYFCTSAVPLRRGGLEYCSVLLPLLCCSWLLVSGAHACTTRLSRTTIWRAMRNSFGTNSSVDEQFETSADFFGALIDVGMASRCAGTLQTAATASERVTLLITPDDAFERASLIMNKGLEEILKDEHLVCDILESSIIFGSLDPRDVQDGTQLNTASSTVPRLRVSIVQDVNIRKLKIYSDAGPTVADVFATDIVVCSQLRGVLVSDLLIPWLAPDLFPSVFKIAGYLPQLSKTMEALRVTESFRVMFESNEYKYDGSVAKSSVVNCAINNGFRAYFLPSNRAWRHFFLKTELTESAVFADHALLLSILLYTELQVQGDVAQDALMSYLSTSFDASQRLRPVGASSFLSAFPGQVEIPWLRLQVDVSRIMPRYMKLSGISTSSRFENTAQVVASDIASCTGVVHVIDHVLIPPTLTAFRQLSLRRDLSMFTEMLRAPVNSELLLELDTPSESNVFVDSIVFAPTDLAIKLTLTYLGWSFEDLLQQEALVEQFVTYHVVGTRSGAGAPERLQFRVGFVRNQQQLTTRLAYPILSKRSANTFEGTPIAKTVRVLSALDTKKLLFAPRYSLQGRLNTAQFITTDVPSTSGGIGIINGALIPPTAELGLSLYDRLWRTPTLRVFRELINVLGLQREFRVQGFGNGDTTIFAPTNAAWFALLSEWTTTQEDLIGSSTAFLFDIILFMVAPRTEHFLDVERETYAPWQSKDARDGDEIITALSVYTSVGMERFNYFFLINYYFTCRVQI